MPSIKLRLKIVSIVIWFLSILLGISASAKSRNPTFIPIQINFADLSKCKTDIYFSPLCRIGNYQFLNWSNQDQRIVYNALKSIPWTKLAPLVKSIKNLTTKPITFAKVDDSSSEAGSLVFTNEVVVLISPRALYSEVNYSGRNELTHSLLHEFFHFYSNDQFGNDYYLGEKWQLLESAVDWTNPNGVHHILNTYSDILQKRNLLMNTESKQIAMNFDHAQALKIGAPSLYSITNIEEFLVEVLTRLVYEPSTVRYLSSSLRRFIETTDFGYLMPPQIEQDNNSEIFPKQRLKTLNYNFVGRLYLKSQPLCTVFLVAHGLAVTAKHCLIDSSNGLLKNHLNSNVKFDVSNFITSPNFVSLNFALNDNKNVMITGSQINKFYPDPGMNDWAYIQYDPALTRNKIDIPNIRIEAKVDLLSDQEIFSVGFTEQMPIQSSTRLISKGNLTGRTGSITNILPNYQGELIDSTVAGWFMSSGSPIFLSEETKPEIKAKPQLALIGVLSHTFDIDHEGNIIIQKLFRDEWGPWTTTNFSSVQNSELHKNTITNIQSNK